jgi:hypothetical protein
MKLARALLPLFFTALFSAFVGGLAPGYFCHMVERNVSACCCGSEHGSPARTQGAPGLRAAGCCERLVAPASSKAMRAADKASEVPAAALATLLAPPSYALPRVLEVGSVPPHSRGPPTSPRLFLLNCSILS